MVVMHRLLQHFRTALGFANDANYPQAEAMLREVVADAALSAEQQLEASANGALGDLLIKMGRSQEAIPFLRATVKGQETNDDLANHARDLLRQLGDA